MPANKNSNRSLTRGPIICGSFAGVVAERMAARRPCRLVEMTSKSRILVVDDEPGILRFLKVALVANDFEFESARSVQEAVKYITSHEPEVVVLDLGLPDGDGKDVIHQVREWSNVPIMVISARDREQATPATRSRSKRSQSLPTYPAVSTGNAARCAASSSNANTAVVPAGFLGLGECPLSVARRATRRQRRRRWRRCRKGRTQAPLHHNNPGLPQRNKFR
jgi:CheY-like chemotaxis protein